MKKVLITSRPGDCQVESELLQLHCILKQYSKQNFVKIVFFNVFCKVLTSSNKEMTSFLDHRQNRVKTVIHSSVTVLRFALM